MKTPRLLFPLACAAFALIVSPAHAAPPQYRVSVLNSLGGAAISAGINARGDVTGSASSSSIFAFHAVKWNGTTPNDLGTLDGIGSYGQAINASGQVAGSYNTSNATEHAVRWTGTAAEDLGTLGGANSFGSGINATGQIAGYSYLPGDNTYHAVRWTGKVAVDLGAFSGENSGGAGINDAGQIVGTTTFAGGSANHATMWNDTTSTDLGTLLGGHDSYGAAINNSGQVTGYSDGFGIGLHAVRWTGTIAEDLGTLGGYNSSGFGINNSGDVVGMSDTMGNAVSHPFLYTEGKMYDLYDLLPHDSGVSVLLIAGAGNPINDLGQIAAYGDIDGQQAVFLLTPIAVPEPSAGLLASVGVVVVASNRANSQSISQTLNRFPRI